MGMFLSEADKVLNKSSQERLDLALEMFQFC